MRWIESKIFSSHEQQGRPTNRKRREKMNGGKETVADEEALEKAPRLVGLQERRWVEDDVSLDRGTVLLSDWLNWKGSCVGSSTDERIPYMVIYDRIEEVYWLDTYELMN